MPARKRPRKLPQLRTSMQVGMTAESHRLIGRAAALRQQPFSTFMRDAAIREANRVLGLEPNPIAGTVTAPALADAGERPVAVPA